MKLSSPVAPRVRQEARQQTLRRMSTAPAPGGGEPGGALRGELQDPYDKEEEEERDKDQVRRAAAQRSVAVQI